MHNSYLWQKVAKKFGQIKKNCPKKTRNFAQSGPLPFHACALSQVNVTRSDKCFPEVVVSSAKYVHRPSQFYNATIILVRSILLKKS
jgi:hypothetical protein